MIVCKQCGHHNEDSDTFCGSCGKFLEWTGERVAVAEPEPEPPAPEPEPEPARLGLIDRVKHAVGMEEATSQPAPPAHPDGAPAPVVASAAVTTAAPATAPARPAPAAQPVWGVPVTSAAPSAAPPAPPAAAPTAPAPEPVQASVAAPAAAPVIPVAQPDEPLSRRPTSVAPAVTRPRPGPRTLEPPTRRHPGDLICGQCGEGNDPTRHFCRRCGNSLDEAIAVRLPWYRRFFNRLLGVRTHEAGWRPQRVGPPNVMGMVWRIIRLVFAALLIVAVLAFVLIPPFREGIVSRVTSAVTTARKAVFPRYDPVYPTGASASTSIAGHLPNLAIDKFTNTYWAARAGDPTPFLKLTFPEPVDLAQIGFDSGAAGPTPADDFLAQPRPHQVHLVFWNGTTTTTKDLTLKDEDPKVAKNAQFYPIDAKHVIFVEIHIMSVFAPTGASPSAVAIAEVEFRVRD